MTSDELDHTQDNNLDDDLPIDDRSMNDDEEYFVLEVEGEDGFIGDDGYEDETEDSTSVAFPEKSDGLYSRAAGEGDEALFDDEAFDTTADDDDLFADIDASSHIEAATADVVASAPTASGFGDVDDDSDDASMGEHQDFVLDSGDDHEIFAGLSDEDEDVDTRWQQENEAMSGDATSLDDSLDESSYGSPDADDFIESDVTDGYSAGGYDEASPSAPPLPPPGYRPAVAKDPQHYGTISSESLRANANEHSTSDPFHVVPSNRATPQVSDFEQDLLGTTGAAGLGQSSGNWGAINSGEFDLVEHENDLSSGRFGAVPLLPPQPQGSQWAAPPEDESHAPDEDDGYDPIYGAPAAAAAMATVPSQKDGRQFGGAVGTGYDHLEEMVQDIVDEPAASVIGGVPRGRVWMRRLMTVSMAASVLVVGIVAFVSLRPDLPLAHTIRETLGLAVAKRSTLEVAEVARPKVDTSFTVPRLEVVASSGSAGTDEAPTSPKLAKVSERSRKRFEMLRDMTQWAGKTSGMLALRYIASRRTSTSSPDGGALPGKSGGVTTDPLAGATLIAKPVPTDGGAKAPANGSGVAPGTSGEESTSPVATTGPEVEAGTTSRKNPPSISGGPHGWGVGILRGAQAFAQLENGHFFVGRVQKVVDDELVMTWGKAEISFLPGELQKLLPIASQEVDILRGGPEGYVKLKNQNKIWGQILEDLPDVVTIQKGEHRIVIPKVAVAQVTKEKKAEVRLGRNDQDWSEDSIPRPEQDTPSPEVQIEPEMQSGAIRVRLDTPMPERSEQLRERIRRVFPVRPSR